MACKPPLFLANWSPEWHHSVASGTTASLSGAQKKQIQPGLDDRFELEFRLRIFQHNPDFADRLEFLYNKLEQEKGPQLAHNWLALQDQRLHVGSLRLTDATFDDIRQFADAQAKKCAPIVRSTSSSDGALHHCIQNLTCSGLSLPRSYNPDHQQSRILHHLQDAKWWHQIITSPSLSKITRKCVCD